MRAVADFYEYLEVVNDAFAQVNQTCLTTISNGLATMGNLLDNTTTAQQVITDLMICEPTLPLTEMDVAFIFAQYSWSFSGYVQYAQPNVTLEAVCEDILSLTGNAYQQMVTWMRNQVGNTSICLSRYEDSLDWYNYTVPSENMLRQWTYQTCTEYGFFQTGNSDLQPFTNNLLVEFYYRMCEDIFEFGYVNNTLAEGVDRINRIFGSVDPVLTRVISTHGTIDPWHRLGVLKDINEDAPTILIPGASHCQDLSSANPVTDFPEMYEAKMFVRRTIANWLGQSLEDDDSTTEDISSPETPSTTPSVSPTTPTTTTTEGSAVQYAGSVTILMAVLMFISFSR